MAPNTPAVCSGSGSLRNLELVQAHSLFTFMGRLTDGQGSILQQSLAGKGGGELASMSCKSFSSCGSLDGSGGPRTHTCAHVLTEAFAG